MLKEEERNALVLNKVRRSRETWAEAKGIIENKYWYAAANRMYYACYYMVAALLLNNGQSAHTHGGIIGFISSKLELFRQKWANFIAKCMNCARLVTMMIGKLLQNQTLCL